MTVYIGDSAYEDVPQIALEQYATRIAASLGHVLGPFVDNDLCGGYIRHAACARCGARTLIDEPHAQMWTGLVRALTKSGFTELPTTAKKLVALHKKHARVADEFASGMRGPALRVPCIGTGTGAHSEEL